MNDKEYLNIFFKCYKKVSCEKIKPLGDLISNLYLEDGFPIELSFGELKLTNDEKVILYHFVKTNLLKHKINTGISEKRLKEAQERNKKEFIEFYKKSCQKI